MRNLKTNFLQIIVLISGVIYFILGLVVLINPTLLPAISGIKVPDDWTVQVHLDSIIFPLYVILRAFGFILIFNGLSFVLPLFDPLKYRGMIYFLVAFQPFVVGLTLLLSSFFSVSGKLRLAVPVALILAIIFLFLGLLAFIGLIITRSDAKKGEE